MLQIAAVVTRIAHEDREAAAALDRRRNHLPSRRRLERVLNLHDRESIARRGIAVDGEIQIGATGRPLGVDAARPWQVLQGVLDIETDLFDRRIVGAVDLDADFRPHSGRQHVQAVADGLRPGNGHAGNLELLVHRRDQLVLCRDAHLGPDRTEDRFDPIGPARVPAPVKGPGPVFARLQHDRRLEHLDGRGIRRAFELARLAEDGLHLRKRHDHSVCLDQDVAGLLDGHHRKPRRHIHQGTLPKLGHEFGAERHCERNDGGNQQEIDEKRGLRKAQGLVENRRVKPAEEHRDGVFLLGADPPPHPRPHQNRHQGHGQDRCRRDREGLREGERVEEPPLLAGQEEDRQEGDDDDDEREEDRAPNLLGSRKDRRLTPGAAPARGGRQMPVRVLDHHNRGVHQHADRQSEASERHDVGGDAQKRHRQKRDDDRDRQDRDRHEGRAEVVEEDEDYEGDHDHFLDQRVLQGIDRPVNQLGAVVSDFQFHARREGCGELRDLRLRRLDDGENVLARSDDHDAADGLSLAVPVHDATAHLRSEMDHCDVGEIDRRARRKACLEGDLLKVLQARDVAPAAHHVFAAGPLDHPPTDVAVGLLHGGQHIVESDSVRGKLGRIDLDLVLLLESADRGDFRDSRHGPKPVGEIPVLERPQVGERVPAGLVHEDVLEAPADARGVGAQVGVDVPRKLSLQAVQVLEHTASRPVQVRAVLEDHVDIGEAEEGVAANGLDLRRGDQGGDDRVRHLVLDQVGVLTLPVRVNDHLHI